MRKLPYQSSLQFIQRPQLLWNDIGDRKLWRGIQWIRRGPTVPSRLSWNAYQSNMPKPRSGVRWKHGMRRFSEYGNVASRILGISSSQLTFIYFRGVGIPPTSELFGQIGNYKNLTSRGHWNDGSPSHFLSSANEAWKMLKHLGISQTQGEKSQRIAAHHAQSRRFIRSGLMGPWESPNFHGVVALFEEA